MSFWKNSPRRRDRRKSTSVILPSAHVETLEDRTLLSAISIGNSDVPVGGNLTLSGLIVVGGAETGLDVNIDGADLATLTISNATLTDNTGNGMVIRLSNMNVDSLVINSAVITRNTDTAIEIVLDNVTLGNLSIIGATIATNNGDGISVTATNSHILAGTFSTNAITGNQGDGVRFSLNGSTMTGVSLENNTRINANNGNGLFVELTNSTATGLRVQNNPEINLNGVSGIRLAATNSTYANLVIAGNTVQGSLIGHGITFVGQQSSASGSITANTISGNAGGGISFDNWTGVTTQTLDFGNLSESRAITGNQITGNQGAGISLVLGSHMSFFGQLAGNTINGNKLGLAVTATGDAQFDIELGNKLLPLPANTFDQNASAGIVLDMTDQTIGHFVVGETTISNTTAGTNAKYNGDGLLIELKKNAQLATAVIDSNSLFQDNADAGFDLKIIELSQIAGLAVRNTRLDGNGTGFRINRTDEAVIDLTLENSELVGNHGNGLDVFLTNRRDPNLKLNIADTLFNGNEGSGFRLETEANAIVQVTANRNTFDGNDVHGLSIVTGEATGFGEPIALVPSVFHNSRFTNNQVDGIHLQADNVSRMLVTFDSPADALANGRTTISGNGNDGILLVGNTSTYSILNVFASDVYDNGNDGVAVQLNSVATAKVTLGDTATGRGNTIGNINPLLGNGGDGIDIVTTGGSVSTSGSSADVRIAGNLVRSNAFNGITVTAQQNSFVQANFLSNTVRFNGERGFNFLLTDYVGDRVNSGGIETGGLPFLLDGNTISDNQLEGLYFETDSGVYQNFQVRLPNTGATSPTNPSSVTNNLLPAYDPADVEFFGSHRARAFNEQRYDAANYPWNNMYTDVATSLTVTNNIIRDNGNGVDSDGVFLNVGTNSYLAADVRDNTFGGNVLSDFRTDSFVSAGNPPNSTNASGAGTYDTVTLDDTAQLDLRFAGNTGDHINVDAIGAIYTNNDSGKQNGTNGNNTGTASTRSFSATSRRADLFRIDDANGLGTFNNFTQFGVTQDLLNDSEGFANNGYILVGVADPLFPSYGFPGLPTATVTAQVGTITEGDSGSRTLSFTVSLSSAPRNTVTVDYATLAGTATSGVDFTPTSGTLTFLAGETTKTVTVSVLGDTLSEANETLFLTLSNPNNAVLDGSVGSGTIIDDDALPTVSIADAGNVTEGNSGFTTATFNVTLSKVSGQTVTVDFATAAGTATSDIDFVNTTGTVTFAAGQTSQTITVNVVGDVNLENFETFLVNLLNPAGATILDGQGVASIVNDDGNPSISVAAASALEGNPLAFVVTLSGSSILPISVQFATNDGTASTVGGLGQSDYTAASGTLAFSPGEIQKTIYVNTITDDVDEDTETLQLQLSSPTNASLGNSTATGSILDGNTSPTLSISDAILNSEGDTGLKTVVLTVQLSHASSRLVSVDFTTQDGSALSDISGGSDYIATSGTVTFAPGETSKTLSVSVAGDVLSENDETFHVVLSNPNAATINDGTGTVVIVDDDPVPNVWLAGSVAALEGNGGTTAVPFTIRLSQVSGRAVTVFYDVQADTASPGIDLQTGSNSVTIQPGQLTATAFVNVVGDLIDEPVETYTVSLTSADGATVIGSAVVGSILNDDAVPTASVTSTTTLEGGTAVVNVSLSSVSGKTVLVDYVAQSGTAIRGKDFNAATGTLVFAPGETQKTISISTLADAVHEANETLQVVLQNPQFATLGTSSGVVTIVDRSAPPQITVDDFRLYQSPNATATGYFTIRLSTVSERTVQVDYATANGTAAEGLHYTPVGGTAVFAPGQREVEVAIPLPNSGLNAVGKSLFVNLSNPVQGVLADGHAVGTFGPQRLIVNGTAANDDIRIYLGNGSLGSIHQVQVNGVLTTYGTQAASAIQINGLGGKDVLRVYGSSLNDTAILSPSTIRLTSPIYEVTSTSTEVISVYGGAGHDRVDFFDSAGADTFDAAGSVAWMSTIGQSNGVTGFEQINAHSTSGSDRAFLRGTDAQDFYVGEGRSGTMYSVGYVNRVNGFARIDAVADGSGGDQAKIYDTPGNDLVVTQGDRGWMSSAGALNVATGFDRVEFFSQWGNNDLAAIYDTAAHDIFDTSPDGTRAFIYAAGYMNIATGFSRVDVYSQNGGQDEAHFRATPGADRYEGRSTRAWMVGPGFLNVVNGFATTTGYSNGQSIDVALLYGNSGNDQFIGQPTFGIAKLIGGNYRHTATGFAQVDAFAGTGGNDRAFLYDTSGNDVFTSLGATSSMTGSGYQYTVHGFSRADAFATSGHDTALLTGRSGIADILESNGNRAWLQSDLFLSVTNDFTLVSSVGQTEDRVLLRNVGGADQLTGSGSQVKLIRGGGGTELRGDRFGRVTAESAAGQLPTANVSGIDYVFEQVGTWL